jgi:anion-transporting  ArsA/GET3 family ATPase
VIVVGSGGVGKTTLSAALGLAAAAAGRDTLVMTFDPSLRLKDALGVDAAAAEQETEVPLGAAGRLSASLLDARATFDRLIERYAPDRESRERILRNRFYDNLSGSLAGVLEYMASERLFEVAQEGSHERIVLDTPPTRQALDFLGAPDRIVSFLDSGALRIALKPWFDAGGQLRATSRLGALTQRRGFFDRMVGLERAPRHGRVLRLQPAVRRLSLAGDRGAAAAAIARDSVRAGQRARPAAGRRHPVLHAAPQRGRLPPGTGGHQPRSPGIPGRRHQAAGRGRRAARRSRAPALARRA